jgi:hypothetical protein
MDEIILTRFIVVSVIALMKILEYYLKLRRIFTLLHSSQFSIHSS